MQIQLPWNLRRWPCSSCVALTLAAAPLWADAQAVCGQPVYLTLETGHMGIAGPIADILRRQQVRATFFAAQDPTQSHDGSLGNTWGTWWKSMAGQGHEFASLTYDHVVWQSDLPGYKPNFRVKVMSGTFAGREFTYDPQKYCAQIERAARRLEDFTEKKSLPLVRAPSGRVSQRVVDAANSCGYSVVGWARSGYLDVTTPLSNMINAIKEGDILNATLGSQSRNDGWLLANLEPLIIGLKGRGLCFETLRKHPAYVQWISSHGG